MNIGKSRDGRQSPYQLGFRRTAPAEELDHRASRCVMSGRGHAHLDDGAGEVPGVEGLLEHLRVPDRLDAHVGPVASGQLADCLHRVGARRVDGVGGAELGGPLELAGVEVDCDDGGGTGQAGPGDGRIAHAAAAEHGHAVARLDPPGEHGRTETGGDPAAEQARGLGASGRVNGGALTGGDQRPCGEGADAEGGAELGAVGERHLLGSVERGEAVLRLTTPARPAGAAHGAPVQDDEVPRAHTDHVVAHRFHDAGGLVAQQIGELVADGAFAVVEVGVAHPAGLHAHQRLSRAGVGDEDRFDGDRSAGGPGDDSSGLVGHRVLLVRVVVCGFRRYPRRRSAGGVDGAAGHPGRDRPRPRAALRCSTGAVTGNLCVVSSARTRRSQRRSPRSWQGRYFVLRPCEQRP